MQNTFLNLKTIALNIQLSKIRKIGAINSRFKNKNVTSDSYVIFIRRFEIGKGVLTHSANNSN